MSPDKIRHIVQTLGNVTAATHAQTGTVLAHWTGHYIRDVTPHLLRCVSLHSCDLVSHVADLPVQVLVRMRSDRVLGRPAPPRQGPSGRAE